jgi:eukaryotic translation initiation factor 2C
VSINPESKSRQTNREVLNELIKLSGKKSLGSKLPAYDGRKSLYTAGSLPFESEEFVVTLVDPEKKDKERHVHILFRFCHLYFKNMFLKSS